MSINEKNLIEKIKTNDHHAFRELVKLQHEKIYQICYGFLRNKEDAEDVTQEVFIEILKSIHSFRGDSSLNTWIYRIAVTRSLNLIKKNKLKNFAHSIEQLIQLNKPEPISHFEPFIQLSQKEQAKIIQKELNKLPKNQNIAFTLHKYNDYSYTEISEIMNLSLSSIESLIHRAKVKLKQQLKNKI